ncbi:hypothetical protein E8E13_003285 [Curvularia kusanoi]|uniref:Uncharacterized protein n=1 Tax=Curvularia kusanoi TaxID=90978 RepID=A0A9P4T5S5_CURKU|nr:hypothetical protein E8E13_003285 [Curvularia kusanoi]
MHLYGIRYRGVRTADTGIVMKIPDSKNLTLTALIAPISLTSLPTFGVDELHTLEESICFHVDESKIPQNVRCSCLKDGRFCLVAEHWLLEFDVGSPLWLGEDGLPRAGSLIRYVGPKHGGKSVIIDKFGERVCCIEGLTSQDVMGGDGSSMQTG